MPEGLPLSWVESSGWIALSGSVDPRSENRALALSRQFADGPIAYISFSDDMGDALMDDMLELGAPAGYLVDWDEGDNNEIYERLSLAGMVVISADRACEGLNRFLTQTVAHALKEALRRGAVILFEGAAAAAAGQYRLAEDGGIASGLKLVGNALILPCVSSIAESASAAAARGKLPEAVFIGLGAGGALALGPDRQIETWGDGRVTIGLGDPLTANLVDERRIAAE